MESLDKFTQDLSAEQLQQFEKQWALFSENVAEITPRDELAKMLAHSLKAQKPLRVKCGVDPTGPDIHLGHLVPYKKMRQFQDMGHIGVVVIGDYTASIGDPTGKNEARPPLSPEKIQENAKLYMDQLFTVLDPAKTEVRFQSEWFAKADLKDILLWAAETTVAKLLAHDTFGQRLEKQQPLALHELFYPVLQGMDSVFIAADIELGGSDQKFNVLMGRDYQKARNLRPQVGILMPIITGLCGQVKMSKSLGNYIAVLDKPFDKFGKVMSIPDRLMEEYWRYLLQKPSVEVEAFKVAIEKGELHPNEAKKNLAEEIVAFFHGADAARECREQFINVFKAGGIPDETPDYIWQKEIILLDLLLQEKIIESKAAGRRLFQQNAVSVVDGAKIEDPMTMIDASFKGLCLKIGKRKFLKIT
jgi:tyrosyl-tRNA synthetase